MKKISFVILHYLDYETTKNCVMSILNNAQQYYANKMDVTKFLSIIIVDNGSPNSSGKELEVLFDAYENIKVILSKENLGFAQGNNLGFKYAKNEINPDCLFVMNNDILIEQKDFFSTLYDNFDQISKYEIIAPDIINLDNYHQNPFRENELSGKNFLRIFLVNHINNIIFRVPFLNRIYYNILESRDQKGLRRVNFSEQKTMIVPHGSCIIYNHTWLKNENYAFNPETFMYFEEDILYKYVYNKGYKTLYFPKIQIKHLEDVSTNKSINNVIKKRVFIAKNMLKSLEIYRKLGDRKN